MPSTSTANSAASRCGRRFSFSRSSSTCCARTSWSSCPCRPIATSSFQRHRRRSSNRSFSWTACLLLQAVSSQAHRRRGLRFCATLACIQRCSTCCSRSRSACICAISSSVVGGRPSCLASCSPRSMRYRSSAVCLDCMHIRTASSMSTTSSPTPQDRFLVSGVPYRYATSCPISMMSRSSLRCAVPRTRLPRVVCSRLPSMRWLPWWRLRYCALPCLDLRIPALASSLK